MKRGCFGRAGVTDPGYNDARVRAKRGAVIAETINMSRLRRYGCICDAHVRVAISLPA